MKYFGFLHCEDANYQLSKSAFRHVREPYSRLMKQLFPRREVADLLVQIFFRGVNWMYEIIHSATFLDQYHDWWNNFPGTAIEDMSFAILLLCICSYTTQFLPSPNYTAATVGGERLSTLSEKCHGIATKLTNLHKSSGAQPTRIDVLQYFFATCFTKNEGRVKDAWDHLGEAIHIAMNLGMHEETRDSSDPLVGGFEIDMRRRTFWNLYIWDRFMAVILDRWSRLPEERCTVAYPYMQMQPSSDSSSTGVPDSYIERLVQAKLARCCSSHYRPSCGKPARYDMHLIEQQHAFLTKELAKLPSVFAIDNPDTQWTNLSLIWLSDVRYLLRFPRSKIQSLSPKERQITYHHRVRFVKHTLALLEDLSRLHTLIGGNQTRLFILAFYTFEAAMGLGMHLISLATVQDLYIFQLAPEDLIREGPWKRETCMREMLTALQRLQVLSEVSVIARIGAREVSQLVLRIKPLFSDSQPIWGMIPAASERLRDYGRINMQSVSNASSGPSSNASLLSETDAVGFGGMQGTGSFTSPNSAAQTFPTPNNELVYESNGFDFAFPYTANADWPMSLLPLNYSWQPQQDEIDLELLFSASTSSTQLYSRYP
ncbi:hypothetical protein HYALB_00001921 [Hymenoscyphus albidus]|uniref:Xylanolytic transcriptional activator regulatory domain-containing protein n=1 Tax=Hymenoscyphus albidus TaxID=595503 RepID=A0A9N9LHU7_9HELO|nr:hypothetical protein HYALB_00001921 [Hymenoscyphus albidus]